MFLLWSVLAFFMQPSNFTPKHEPAPNIYKSLILIGDCPFGDENPLRFTKMYSDSGIDFSISESFGSAVESVIYFEDTDSKRCRRLSGNDAKFKLKLPNPLERFPPIRIRKRHKILFKYCQVFFITVADNHI